MYVTPHGGEFPPSCGGCMLTGFESVLPPPPPGVVPFWVTGRCRRRFRQPKGLRIPSQLLPSSNASHRSTDCRPVVGARRAREQGGGAQGRRRARGSAQAAARRRYRAGVPCTLELQIGLEGALVGQVPWPARVRARVGAAPSAGPAYVPGSGRCPGLVRIRAAASACARST